MIRVSLCGAHRRRRMIGPIKMHRASSRPSILPHCGTQPFEPRDSRPEPGTPAHRCIKSPSKHTSRKGFASRWSSSPFRPRREKRTDTRLPIYREDVDEGCGEEVRKSSSFVDFFKQFSDTNTCLYCVIRSIFSPFDSEFC